MRRRDLFRYGRAVALGAFVQSSIVQRAVAACSPAQSAPGPYGPLLAPDANGIMLPQGFTSRILTRGGQMIAGTGHTWHTAADGGATFRAPGGWIYVSNSESAGPVNVSALRFDRMGEIAAAYPILFNTFRNCAGGSTPWGTWLSCEEFAQGHVWECDPTGTVGALMRPALGTFQHEAVVADPARRQLFLTEDRPDGGFYRFRPSRWRDLSAGALEVASVDVDGNVSWHPVPDPDAAKLETRYQVPAMTTFAGGEGITCHRGHVYFTTKGDNRIWDYDARRESLSLLYAAADDPQHQLTGVDNVVASRAGDLVVAEDGGNMELVLISPDRTVSPLLRVIGQDSSELTGPAFDPRSGTRLYFSSQRGDGGGITYEVTGPFRRQAPPRARC